MLWETTTPEEFNRTENRELFTQLLAAGTMDELQHRLDESLVEHFTRLTESDIKPTTRQSAPRAIQEALGRLKQRHLRDRQAEILESLDIEPGAELPKDIEDSIVDVNSKLKETYLVGVPRKTASLTPSYNSLP